LSFSIPYSRRRRYLTGIDWLMGGMHHSALRFTGVGALSQAILDLDGSLPETPLRSALDQISARLPILHGRVARDWLNLAPYWKLPRRAGGNPISLRVVDLPSDAAAEAQRLLADHVNQPLAPPSDHLSFLLIRLGNQRSRLGMVFDHRLFDAIGAESFLRLIDQTWQGNLDQIAPKVKLTEPAHLDHWSRRFRSGKLLNAGLLKLAEREVCALKMPAAESSPRVRFCHASLTIEQTERFRQRAAAECGMPILLPSAAARAVLSLQHAIPIMPLPGQQYLVFTSASTRAAGQEWESLFFNHLSFLPFSIDVDPPQSPTALVLKLRDQLFEQMRQGIPAALQDASALVRICPHWLGSRSMGRMFKGRLCSFYFACLRETGFPERTFLGLPAVDLIHTPTAFAPPGMNLCMTTFGDRFNLVLSYLDGVLEDSAAAAMMGHFKSLLVE
jgi:hypothetical protein